HFAPPSRSQAFRGLVYLALADVSVNASAQVELRNTPVLYSASHGIIHEVLEAVGDNLPDFKLAAHLHKVGYSAKSLQLWPLEVAHANLPITECLRMTGGVDAHRCPFPEKSALNVFTEAVGASPAGKDRQGILPSINDLHINVIAITQGRGV
ncbi:hypothetical protein K443DRAFT_92355, partial [Laccaria amethystina LaAM-08-1]